VSDNRFFRLALAAEKSANSSQWVGCLAAFYTDNYSDLARILKVHRSTIYRRAMAYQMLGYIRKACDTRQGQELRRLRLALSPRHFTTLYELFRRYEFGPMEALSYLQDAEHAGMNAEQMAVEVSSQEEHKAGARWVDWVRFAGWLRDVSLKLQDGKVPQGLPDNLHWRALALADEIDDLAAEIREQVDSMEKM